MGVQLLVRDGNPYWYLSPDIWVVPGTDPNGSPGSPMAGHPAYLWAHVANTGDASAQGIRVDFFWANPALQVLRSNSTLVGSAYANVAAGGAQDVLCLVPWMPLIVNGGHECLVVTANHPADPLPQPPPDDFDPPAYRQVAQKNLTVLATSAMSTSFPITISGWQRAEKVVVIQVEVGGQLEDSALVRLGLKGVRPAKDRLVDAGLSAEASCVPAKGPLGSKELRVAVPRGTSAGVHLALRAGALSRGEYQLVNVRETLNGKILGGLGFVVVADQKDRKQ